MGSVAIDLLMDVPGQTRESFGGTLDGVLETETMIELKVHKFTYAYAG